jgi:hypothetical protein
MIGFSGIFGSWMSGCRRTGEHGSGKILVAEDHLGSVGAQRVRRILDRYDHRITKALILLLAALAVFVMPTSPAWLLGRQASVPHRTLIVFLLAGWATVFVGWTLSQGTQPSLFQRHAALLRHARHSCHAVFPARLVLPARRREVADGQSAERQARVLDRRQHHLGDGDCRRVQGPPNKPYVGHTTRPFTTWSTSGTRSS